MKKYGFGCSPCDDFRLQDPKKLVSNFDKSLYIPAFRGAHFDGFALNKKVTTKNNARLELHQGL